VATSRPATLAFFARVQDQLALAAPTRTRSRPRARAGGARRVRGHELRAHVRQLVAHMIVGAAGKGVFR
jgi:hypothetical protein